MSVEQPERGELDLDVLRRLSDEALREIVRDESFGMASFDAIGVLRERCVDPFADEEGQ